jgi:predicted TIM-barrel fold metal-dependent hydrolase
MFGSDWPVCVVAGGWARWAAAAEELLAPLSAAELGQVLTGTATRAYGLGIAAGNVLSPSTKEKSSAPD